MATSNVYDRKAFSARVNYAAQCIRSGHWEGRRFSTCFMMGDGDYVGAALVRRAEHDDRLSANIYSALVRDYIQGNAAKYAHLDNKGLKVAALAEIERRILLEKSPEASK